MPTIEQARNWYTDSDPVHDFEHVLRVYRMAERLAEAEGADVEIVRAAALLHDAQGSAADSELRAEHQYASADFAAQILSAEGWDVAVPADVDTLREALSMMTQIRNRFIASRDELEPGRVYTAALRLQLDKSQLPKAFQVDALGAKGWSLSSDWYRWTVRP